MITRELILLLLLSWVHARPGKTKTASADDETETSSMLFNEDDDTSLTNEQTFADEMLHLMEFVDSWTSLEIGDTNTSFTVIASIVLGAIWISVLFSYTVRFYLTHKGQRKLHSQDIQKIFDKKYAGRLDDHTSILNKMWSEDAIRRMQEQPSETAGRLSIISLATMDVADQWKSHSARLRRAQRKVSAVRQFLKKD
ncbi:Oidioi.mRNA.OKI2018_I69.chr2.g8428.t2.cds [Oikopleura dioica]|uniref:Oidioi.mRNA.OKI2018_I69.chr2.g8428.t2.cds n=1 Tax=Oikopleura dioica TaxID=34765 RepID=A0ABN7TGV4_OIKDI|nr:Oidioi.mRNA.OKI2018_I69.chr2.g8428.t2.cds [Oikopleura dioica]